jgi:hypothetical protein
MTEYEGVIDCAKRVITLTTPEKKRIRFKSTFELKGSKMNSLKGVSLEDVRVVKEYPDVFPEELPQRVVSIKNYFHVLHVGLFIGITSLVMSFCGF